MTFRINDGPLAGREGDKVQSRVIRERLLREAEGNVAIKITEGNDNDSFEVAGRGELQLAVLIENMRREGFELTIGRPRVVMQEENGVKLEPIEEVIIDVDDEYSGVVVQKLTERKGDLVDMRPSGVGRQRLRFYVPTRSLIGYQPELLSDTRGTAIFNRLFHEYQPYKGALPGRRTGVLISNGTGQSVAFALWNLEDRGPIMIDAGVDIYEGMIIGEHVPRERSRGQRAQGQAADQHPHHVQGRSGAADHAQEADARAVARLHRRRRICRSDAQEHPPAQDLARPERPQEAVPRQAERVKIDGSRRRARRVVLSPHQLCDDAELTAAAEELTAGADELSVSVDGAVNPHCFCSIAICSVMRMAFCA